jgi:putative transposase
LFSKKIKISEFIVDETVIKVGSEFIWLWIAIKPTNNKEILGFSISKERNMFVTERFLSFFQKGMANIQFQNNNNNK